MSSKDSAKLSYTTVGSKRIFCLLKETCITNSAKIHSYKTLVGHRTIIQDNLLCLAKQLIL